MATRFFTSDWHLGMYDIMKYERRGTSYGGPFKDVNDMASSFLHNTIDMTTEDDVIIHIGDLATFTSSCNDMCKPMEFVKKIPATFINIRGNHDINNKVKSVGDSMQIHLGKRYPNVVCGHYPSYDARAKNYIKEGWILLCGHVHSKWKHCLDVTSNVLNINVGVDVWKYNIVSEDVLVRYVDSILATLRTAPNKIHKVKVEDGKAIAV